MFKVDNVTANWAGNWLIRGFPLYRFLDIFDKEENVGKKILLDSAAKQLGM